MTLVRQTALVAGLLAAGIAPRTGGQEAQAPAGGLQAARPSVSQSVPASSQSVPVASQGVPVTRLSPAERAHNAIAALPSPGFNNTTVVIDPAHGGSDNGSRINDSIVEKDVTLSLAFRLRSLLSARGFNVVLTRDNDAAKSANPPFAPLTLDDRAGMANHERAAACLVLHATSRGTGVHLYSSELEPAAGETTPEPWLTGQAAWVTESQQLARQISGALARSRLPLVSGAASVRPLDSLTCPALVVELAPNGDDAASINDQAYQDHVAEALAGALVQWKDTVRPPPHLAPLAPASEVQP